MPCEVGMSVKPKDFKPDDGYWIFDDKKLYLMDGSMMNRTWLMVTELMRRRKDLVDKFLKPYRDKMEKTLSIPQWIVRDAGLEEQKENSFEQQLNKLGVRTLGKEEKIDRG